MSYCRWSSDDFQCDVYCYEDVCGGYSINVAGSRPKISLDDLPELDGSPTAWLIRQNEVLCRLDDAEYEYIGLEFDGERYDECSAGAAADRLELIRQAGYNVHNMQLTN